MQMQVSHQSTPEDIKRYLTHLEEGGRSIPPQPVCCPCLELLAEHACGSEQRTAGWAAQPNVTSAPEGAYESTLGGTKNMRKRILASLMALILALSLLPTAALATGETQEPEQEAQIPVSEDGTEGGGEDATIPVETGDETDTSDGTETPVVTTPTVTPTETTPVETLTPVVQTIEESDVAAIGDKGYATLAGAIAEVTTGQTIVLRKSIDDCEEVTINRTGVTFTIDFQNQSLNSVSDTWAIQVQAGTVILRNGTVQGAHGGISCSAGAHVTLQNMTVSKTKTTGTKGDLSAIENSGTMVIESGTYNTAGGTFAPTILNLAEMTIEGGTFETGATDSGWSVMICRGGANTSTNTVITGGSFVNEVGYGITCSNGANVEFGGTAYVRAQSPALGGNNTTAQENFTVTGGTLISEESAAIFFPAEGKLEISDGTITGLTGIHALMGDIEISGGTITGTATKSDIEEGYPGSGSGPRSNGSALLLVSNYYTTCLKDNGLRVNITDGIFNGASNAQAVSHMRPTNPKDTEFTISITGGTFSTDPSDYVAEGYAAFEGGDDSETVYVVKKPQYTETEEVRETAQAGKTDASVSDTIVGDKTEAKEAAESVAESASGNSVLAGAALSEAQAADKDTAITELAKKKLITIKEDGTIAGDKTVSVVAQYYFNVTATAYAVDGSDDTRNAITFDITPMYQLVATTADLEQGGSIVTDDDDDKKNAVPLGKPQVLEISDPITMTLDLPSGFFGSEQNPTTAYVTHFKDSGAVYQYTADVTTKVGDDGYTITFENPNGFSLMRVTATQFEAAIGEQTYPTLEDAIAAVASSSEKTITLLDDVTVRGQIKIDDAEVILNGNNHILSAAEGTKIEDGGLIDITADKAIVQNMTINTNGSAKYGVQFYNSTGGELIGVTINGGYYSSVNVNASEVDMTNCTLNPGTGSYATIDYSIGSAAGLRRIPEIELNNVTTNNAGGLKIWADNATVKKAQALLGQEVNVAAAIRDKIDTTNNDAVLVSIEVTEGGAPADITIPSTKPVIPVTPDDDDDTPSYSGGSSSSETSYSNTIDASDGGSVKVSPRTPSRGETVTITPTPDTGYEVDEVIVTDRNGDEVDVTANRNGTYTFEQPRGRVTIEVTFVRTGGTAGAAPFLDVAEDAWYADAVAYVYDNGLMSGTSTTLFSPNATTTRGMIVTMLYRLEGEPRISSGSAFDDVDAGMYYADAVAWASQNDIVTGYDEATFGPNNAITREQMAAILYRYAQYKGYRTTADADLSGYVDADSVSSYALASLQWANAAGLVTGTSSNTLTPDGSATRAQVATIFMRFMEDVAE